MSRKPNPDQPDRCQSIDPHGDLQCSRDVHADDRCQFGGIGWKKGTPSFVSDRERASRLEGENKTLKQAMRDLVNRRAEEVPNDSVVEAFQMLEEDWNEERAKIKAVLKVVDYLVDREACLLQWRDDQPWPQHERRRNFEDRATEVRQAAEKIRKAAGEA